MAYTSMLWIPPVSSQSPSIMEASRRQNYRIVRLSLKRLTENSESARKILRIELDPPAGMTLKVRHMKCLPIQCCREMNMASGAPCCKSYLQGARLSDPLLHLLAELHVLCLDFSSNTA